MRSVEAANDTIASLATPPGRGGIGIVRISGPRAAAIGTALLGRLPSARKAVHTVFRGARGEELDEGIALYFRAPHSYTGEDVIELQGHGGPVVTQAVLAAALDAGARLAEPGEYTQRAFLNGKLDLAQAEAVADLIDAASLQAARSALRSLSGEFSSALKALADELTDLRALTEATLDFPEEEVDPLHHADAEVRLEQLRAALEKVLGKSRQGSVLRNGIHVVLVGRPNVGKSSLMNRLAGEDRAIVTPVPGTTRDALRETLLIEGVPIVLVDTAGLHTSRDEVERLGMERTRQEMARADLVVVVLEAPGNETPDGAPDGIAQLRVINKIDLEADPKPGRSAGGIRISAKTGAGLDDLRKAIVETAGWRSGDESVFLARERHLRALARAKEHLAAAASSRAQPELFAEELRLTQDALGEIVGSTTADDLLGEIFSRFCIGK